MPPTASSYATGIATVLMFVSSVLVFMCAFCSYGLGFVLYDALLLSESVFIGLFVFVLLMVSSLDEILAIYVLNLAVTGGMFAVIIFRAWIELKNYKLIWREMEWRKNYDIMRKVLKAERDMFSKVEGGEELYKLLSEMFQVNE